MRTQEAGVEGEVGQGEKKEMIRVVICVVTLSGLATAPVDRSRRKAEGETPRPGLGRDYPEVPLENV